MISGEFKALSRQTSEIERLRSRLLSRTALCGVISMGMFFGGGKSANAGPEGSVVVHGGVTIQKSGTHTQFNQSSDTAILNHKSFDIRANESVNFKQPGANSLAVNRVVGSDVSTTIAGKLTATGNVWVLNPSGVAISSGAQINVNGLLATTAKISDDAILAGRNSGSFAFEGAADGTSVTNGGAITAGDGHVVLVAPVVENSGTITTQGSEIALGAGSGFTVDMGLDGLTRFEVQAGDGVSLTNTGTLSAEGGAVYMSAAATNSVEGAVVSVGGEVEATRIENRGGQIVITGGDNGKVEVSGTLDASQVTGDGGQIVVTGQEVDIKGTAVIDASGASNGGKVEIGGGLQGRAVASPVVRSASATAPEGAPLPIAKKTTVREGAVITANAGTDGNGGEVIVWADESTEFRGHIEAKGGSNSGNGGFAEVSGKRVLTFAGTVDMTAQNGFAGELLLDPDNITISAAVDSANVLNVTTLLTALNAASVTINTSAPGLSVINGGADGTGMDVGNITIDAAIATNITGTDNGNGGTTLTLIADNDITVNAAISEAAGNPLSVDFQADNNINLNSTVTTTGTVTLTADADASGVGTIDFSGGGTVSGGNVALSAGQALAVGGVTVTAASSTLSITTSNDNITQVAATTIATSSTTNTTLNAGTGNITLNEANTFASNGATGFVSVTGGDVAITNFNGIDIGTASPVTSLTVTSSGGAVSTQGAIDATANITLNAADEINVRNNITSTGGNIALNADTNAAGNENIALTGGVTVSANGSLSVTGGATSEIADVVSGMAETTALVSGADLTLMTVNFLEDNLAITATDLEVPSNVTVAGSMTITNPTADDAVSLGAIVADPTAGTFELTNTEIGRIDVGTESLTIISAGGAMSLDTADFVTPTIGSVVLDVSGGTGAGSVDFVTAASQLPTLSVTAGTGGIIDSTGSVSVTGSTTLTSTGVVTLDGDNDFSQTGTDLLHISASGQSVVVNDVDDVVLGAVTAGSMTLTAGGTIEDSANTISITGATSLSAIDSLGTKFFDILLDQPATHTFGGVVSATGEDIKLETTGGLALGAITTNDDASDDLSSNGLGPAGNNGDFIVFANGTISDDGTSAISISGETTLNASGNDDVALDNGTHTFTGLFSATGEQVQVLSAAGQTLSVGAITANGGTNDTTLGEGSAGVVFLTEGGEELLLTGGDIILSNADFSAGTGTTVDYALLTYDAGSTVTGTSLTNLTVNTHLSMQSTGALTVSAASITAPTVSVVTSDAAAVTAGQTFTDGNDITFSGANVITGNLRAVSGDDILQAGGSSVSVTGTTYLLAADNTVGTNAQEITLTESGNDFGGTVDALSSGAIALTDQDAIELGLVSAGFGETDTTGTGRNLTVSAGGTVTQTDATRQIFVRGDADGAGGTLVVDQDRAITAIVADDLEGARVEVADIASVTGNAGASDVLLNNANNDFDRLVNTTGQDASLSGDAVDAVDVTAEDILLFDRDAIALGTITTTAGGADATSSGLGITNFTGDDGDIVVDAAGSITDAGGETLTIAGSASLDATTSFDVLIENGGGSSTFTDAFFAVGEQVSVRQSGTLTVGTITAGGGTNDTTINTAIGAANGDVFLTAGGEIISGADINLFNMDTSSGVLNAPDILLTFDSAQTVNTTFLTGLNATNSLSVRTTDTNNITVEGVTTMIPTVTFATSDLTAGSVGNSTGGNIAFDTSASSFVNLRAISGGNISQGAGISASGSTFFLAADNTLAGTLQTITLNNSSNDFQSTVDALASGAISLRDTNAIQLGVVSAGYLEIASAETSRTLTVQAGTDITQQNQTTQAGGVGTATSGGRAIAVRGDADTTPGTLGTDLEGARVEVADATTLTAGGTIDLDNGADISNSDAVDNNFDRVVDTLIATGNLVDDAIDSVTITAPGQTVTVVDEDAIVLGAVSAGTLSVGAGGTIADTANQITVTGETSLVALNDQGNASTMDDEFFDILIDAVDTHDFGGAFNATGEDVVVDDMNALILGAITTNDDINADPMNPDPLRADLSSDETASTLMITSILTGNQGDLIVNAGGSITDTVSRAISVDGTTSITAVDGAGTNFFDIRLDNDDSIDGDYIHNFNAAGNSSFATSPQFRLHAVGEHIAIEHVAPGTATNVRAGTITANTTDGSLDST
ncbi:MAG: filamentous hemagglutinin N-terminal domain-containing protein, partial [Pseudomonadota bacterium]